jgi:anti-anti-sigma factor
LRPGDLQSELVSGILRARILGEIDMSNAAELGDAVAEATPNDAIGIVLDLSDVEYVDSAGIQLIYRLRETLRARGQRMALVIPEDSIVNDALRLAGIEQEAGATRSLEEATRLVNPRHRSGDGAQL